MYKEQKGQSIMAKRRRRYRRGRREKRGFSSWSLGKKIGAIFGGTLALVAAAGAILLASKLSKMETTVLNPEKLNVSKEARERGTGYLNVALFGVDSRDNKLDEDTRSDAIMVASLNRETLEVKIVSVYRDTLLEQDDGSLNKANAAYSFGGPQEAIAMLNKNLDLDIEHYVTVNFNAMIDVIDAVGGVEIDVQEDEVQLINGYSDEIMRVTGKTSQQVQATGVQTLNGIQATAYSRIRYTAGDDFKRAERQRVVLSEIIKKLQHASLPQINKIIDKVFPQVSTNFTIAEIFDYAKDAFSYKLGEMTGFPFDKTTDTLNEVGSVVIPVTLEDNVIQLHKFLYGNSVNYSPSSTVAGINGKILSKAGDRNADSNEMNQEIMKQPEETYNNGQYYYNQGTLENTGNYNNSNTDTSQQYNQGTGTGGGTGGNQSGGTDVTGGGNAPQNSADQASQY